MENKLQTCFTMLEGKPILQLDIQNLAKIPAPKVDFNMGDIGMLSIDILLAMATHDMLIKQGIYYYRRYYEMIYFILFFHQIKNGKCCSDDDSWCSCERLSIYRRHFYSRN